MRQWLMVVLIGIAGLLNGYKGRAQAQELEQLALDIEKLAQFKQILSDLKKGYTILSGGYNTIKNLSEGNFSLHKGFLDGLLAVSPSVKKYAKCAAIIRFQMQLLKEYKAAFSRFKQAAIFSPAEIDYLSRVYAGLFEESLKNLDALLDITTADKLRMSDDERLTAIDGIYASMQDKLFFLRHFNNQASVLLLQRTKDKNEAAVSRSLYGIEK